MKYQEWSEVLIVPNIAAGASTDVVAQVQDYPFEVSETDAAFWINAVNGASIVGTPLLQVPGSIAASNNTHPSTSLVRVQLNIGSTDRFSKPIPSDLAFGTRDSRRVLLRPWLIEQKQNITLSVTNLSAVAIAGMVVLHGRKLR